MATGTLTPSYKVAVPTLVQALGTVTLALVRHKVIDLPVFAGAAGTLITAILGYLTPHKPVRIPRPRRPHRRGAKPEPPPAPFVTVFDATSARQLRQARVVSSSRDALAGYIDGLYRDTTQMRQQFPGHHVYTLAVWATDDADFLDSEPQNVIPNATAQERAAATAEWAARRLHAGAKLVGVYADRSDWVLIDQELRRLAISLTPRHQGGPLVRFIADPTGDYPHIPAGFDGCQWRWRDGYDESLFYTASLS